MEAAGPAQGAHILLVDDNATNRRLVATLLAHENYRVSEASDGAEALALARRDRPQLVISDILMPTMDGYEFVRQLRADPLMSDLRVIFYTANFHEREAATLARQCGVSRVIVKPCRARVLLQAIADELAGTAPAAPAAPPAAFDVDHLRLITDKLSHTADSLRQTNARLTALTELNLHMASERDPRLMLHSVCARARTLLGARFAVLAVVDHHPPDGVAVFLSGLSVNSPPAVPDPRQDTGLLGEVFRTRNPVRLSRPEAPLELGLPAVFAPVHAALIVPVGSLTRTHGWLCLGDKLGATAFDAEDERLLAILGAQLGRIYENGRLYREVQSQAAQLQEEMEQRGRATAQLKLSEERFRELTETIQDVFFVAGPDMVHTWYVSPAFNRVWGRPPSDMLHRKGAWMETVAHVDRERIAQELQQVLAAFPAAGQLEFRILRHDGTQRWVLTRIFPILDADGAVVRTVGVSRDITDRKLAELRIMRLNRTHSVLSGINSLIVRATDRVGLLWDACRLAVDDGGFRGAWCGLLDEAGTELVPAAYAGDAEDLGASIRLRIDVESAQHGLVAGAMLSAQIRYLNDLAQSQQGGPYRQELLARGYRSLVALPLVVAGRATGCLVLLADIPDYFDPEELRLLAELADDISFAIDHIGKSERLDYLSNFDPLTGLANRLTFERRMAQYVEMASHTQAHFALVITDPEHFEAVNTTLGRAAGDEVLRQVGERFAEAAGGRELTAHMGSDQFAFILPGVLDATRITQRLEELWTRWLGKAFVAGGRSVELTAKAGVACYPADGRTPDALISSATAALREAKLSGKRVGFYSQHLAERFADRMALERDLRRALENGEYELHYQPKVDLEKRRIQGVEALLRWRRPGHGLVMPDAFVPLLEETGLISDVGAWALQRACDDRAAWAREGRTVPRVAVNISTAQLHRDDFVPLVSRIVAQPGNAQALELEVTESLAMEDVIDNVPKLFAIRELGVGLALDDFGTGYSSLSYLTRLPVDALKIDRSFISSMLEDRSVMTLVSSIISLARSMKLDTIAEGVESEEQARALQILGCDQIQGYLISRPLPPQDIATLLSG